MRRDGSYVKTERLNQIAAKVSPLLGQGEKVNIAKLISWIEVTIGLTRKKAGEYINILADVYEWEVKNGFLVLGFCEEPEKDEE